MTIQVHLIHEELSLIATQGLAAEKATTTQEHLQICSACRNQLSDVCLELALTREAIEQRELPVGARQRFLEKVASLACVEPKAAPPKVESIAAAGERQRTSRHSIPVLSKPAIQKKSLLHMTAPAATAVRKTGHSGSKVETTVNAASTVVAARAAPIFST